jgi:hypothetical protein
VTYVTAHDDIRQTRRGQHQVFIVFRIPAFPDRFGGFDSLRDHGHDVEDPLAAFDSDEAIKLRAEDNLVIFVLDRL